jgi:hypothetical protein
MRNLMAAMLPALALTAAAPAPEPAAPGSCSVSAFLVGSGEVRAAPLSQAAAIPLLTQEGSGRATISGHRAGWFRVSRIIDAETGKLMFEGDGWLPAAELGLAVANSDPRLYAAPYRGSRVLARLTPDETMLDLVGCSGDFMQVRAEGRVGWLSPDGQCSNPLTTCS